MRWGLPKNRLLLPFFLLNCSLVLAQGVSTPPAGGDIRGLVKSGNTPIPGVTVSAANSQTGQEVTTSTDNDGSYLLHVPSAGQYVVHVQMAAFAPNTSQVAISDSNPAAQLNFDLVLLSRSNQRPAQPVQSASARPGRGQHFGLNGITADDNSANPINDQVVPQGMPVPGLSANAATESVAVSGNINTQFSGMSTAEMQQRMQEMREDRSQGLSPGGGGGPGGPPRGPRGGGGGGGPMMALGGSRRFDINRPHGTAFYTLGDSALGAAPYSLTGQPVSQAGYLQHTLGGSVGGPLNIPKIYHGGDKTFFFISFNGARVDNPYDAFSTVPTLAERNGNFSSAPAVILNPQTQQPFVGNVIPSGMINSAARGLLNFIPSPNLPGSTQNFHFVTSATNNSDDFNLRLVHAFGGTSAGPRRGGGRRNNFNAGFHYHTSDNKLTNPLPTVGGSTSTRGIDVPLGYVRSFGRLTNITRIDFNRNRISTQNLYAFAQDITGDLGIAGVSQNPFDFGLPNLSFTHFASINDINPLLRRDQTLSASDFMIWRRGRHTLRWGGDFRRIQLNTETDNNARGSFTFTGAKTADVVNGRPVQGTGFDFADFLLGLPQLTSVQFGNNNYRFRGNSWDLFLQDDFRVRGNLTLNFGLRYEYVSPLRELNNLIANLDINPSFTQVFSVLPGQTGPFNGIFPSTLVKPDRNNFAPRIGIAWKAPGNMVVRAGYGINYNTSAYQSIVQQLAFQPPFSRTDTHIGSPALPLTLQNGFPAPAASAIPIVTNNYAVNPDYALGYVQIWNLDIQRELRPSLVLNLDYTGTKGTRLDIVEDPNETAIGLRIRNAQPFLWETSSGDSVAHAGSLRLRKRLQNGVSVGGTYTYSKSIDNASTIGGGTTVVAQNAFDLAAERGLSSFDQRHKFTADYLWELPFGHDKRWLNENGVLRDVLGDWQWSGDWTIASGLPFTPRVLGNFTDVNRGVNGTLRADLTGQPIALSTPSTGEWFNTAAFTVPPAGQFGDAGRNSITGPGSRLFNMALTKVIPLAEGRMLEIRAQASNVFNTPQFATIDTIVNSPSFGRVISVGNMRQIQIAARFRF